MPAGEENCENLLLFGQLHTRAADMVPFVGVRVNFGKVAKTDTSQKLLNLSNIFPMYYPIAHLNNTRFQTFRHFTSIDGAISILKKKEIFGLDVECHGNFTVMKKPQPGMAKFEDVILTFEFCGPQIACFSTDFSLAGYIEKGQTIPGKAYHFFNCLPQGIIPGTNIVDARTLLQYNGYWQTNIYPGTQGLLKLNSVLVIPKRPVRPLAKRMIFSSTVSKYAESIERYDEISKKFLQLDILGESRIGEVFSIPVRKIGSQ